ncbi:MAG: hypothetical protein WA274_08240 [Candidatus Acidiferrales bacterium]
MRTHKRTRVTAAAVAVAVLFAATLCQATTLERMSLAKMAQTAPLIIRARCLANSTAWDAGEIWTFTNFAIEETWKGAHVVAVDADTGSVIAGTLAGWTCNPANPPTHFDGSFDIERLPVGHNYNLYAEPLVGLALPSDFSEALAAISHSLVEED